MGVLISEWCLHVALLSNFKISYFTIVGVPHVPPYHTQIVKNCVRLQSEHMQPFVRLLCIFFSAVYEWRGRPLQGWAAAITAVLVTERKVILLPVLSDWRASLWDATLLSIVCWILTTGLLILDPKQLQAQYQQTRREKTQATMPYDRQSSLVEGVESWLPGLANKHWQDTLTREIIRRTLAIDLHWFCNESCWCRGPKCTYLIWGEWGTLCKVC